MSKTRRLIIATVIAFGAVTTAAVPALAATTPATDISATSTTDGPAGGQSTIWDW